MDNSTHKAGFVSIIGKPNAGKSTLMNSLVGERISIVTSKAQTTRHRIMGILTNDEFQIVYSDTPGILEPKYALHKAMMSFVNASLEDADVVLFVTEMDSEPEPEFIEKIQRIKTPVILVLNKIDLAEQEKVVEKLDIWTKLLPEATIIPVSALDNFNTQAVLQKILEYLPFHPPYYAADELTDKTERFIASEIVREKIFLNYEQEIPYCCEVQVTDFVEEPELIRVRVEILVERDSQKGIMIGKGGKALKTLGYQSRKEMEAFFGKKIFLEQFVKVEKDWRKSDKTLKKFGY
jgi:GTPase